MRGLRVMTMETFTLLRRDRIFAPIAILAVAIAAFANMASGWSIEEFAKVLNDVGFFGFQLMGGLVALFWGVKSVAEARTDGSLESQLAWPMGRATWILGKYLGLALALLLLGALALVVWQGLMLINKFGWMRPQELQAFGGIVLGWLVLGALAVFFSSFMSFALAAFVGMLMWIAGLMAAAAARVIVVPGTSDASGEVVRLVARLWDLTQFNLVDHALKGGLPPAEIAWRASYGGVMILALITAACIVFVRRDGTL